MSKQKIVQRIYDVIEENKTYLKNFPCGDSIFYVDVKTLPSPVPRFESTHVEVIEGDTFDVASQYENCMALNMASDRTPGGGCKHGSRTQEEMLMYRSNYLQSLQRMARRYPLQFFNSIYTPSVLILRKNEIENFEKVKNRERRSVACVAIPALRNPKVPQQTYSESDRTIMTEKIRGIFKIGALHGHDTLILGALGCGAFNNPPVEVANIFKKVIKEYDKCFKKIIFAIINSRRWDNYAIFKNVFET